MTTLLNRKLGNRSVTVESDEALRIATLLDLEMHRILRHEFHEDRMKEIWRFISIDAGIIFIQVERLNLQGFRWAPKSLLHPRSVTYVKEASGN